MVGRRRRGEGGQRGERGERRTLGAERFTWKEQWQRSSKKLRRCRRTKTTAPGEESASKPRRRLHSWGRAMLSRWSCLGLKTWPLSSATIPRKCSSGCRPTDAGSSQASKRRLLRASNPIIFGRAVHGRDSGSGYILIFLSSPSPSRLHCHSLARSSLWRHRPNLVLQRASWRFGSSARLRSRQRHETVRSLERHCHNPIRPWSLARSTSKANPPTANLRSLRSPAHRPMPARHRHRGSALLLASGGAIRAAIGLPPPSAGSSDPLATEGFSIADGASRLKSPRWTRLVAPRFALV
jgi:hypothetical protein